MPVLSVYRRCFTSCWFKGELFVFGSSFDEFADTVERVDMLRPGGTGCMLHWTLPNNLCLFSVTEASGTIFLCGGRVPVFRDDQVDEPEPPSLVPQSTVYCFKEHPEDPREATFELVESARLVQPRHSHTSIVFRGKLWIAGGRHDTQPPYEDYDAEEREDEISNTPADPFCHHRVEFMDLSAAAPAFVELPTTRRDRSNWRLFHSRLLVVNDELYCISFAQPPSPPKKGEKDGMLIEKLDLDTKEWVCVGPVGRSGNINSARGINVGALDSTIFVFDLWKWIAFDLTTGTWHGPNKNEEKGETTRRGNHGRWGALPPGRNECRNGNIVQSPIITWS